jgi:hypothetical protein
MIRLTEIEGEILRPHLVMSPTRNQCGGLRI